MTSLRDGLHQADLAPSADDLDGRAVTTIRMLAADAVQAAGSGHPGLPMGAATPAYVLWSRFLRHDPSCPDWPDRDRFVLSAGHGSMLLYALLHLFGYDLPASELRRFRQWGSRTPGHPEFGHTVGVETTTGPLGQGIANAVGMALAERMLAARYNRDGAPPLVDHRTFVLASDGDLMEGISHEAASLAGHLRLGRLVVIHDDNRITIDGRTDLSCSDDTGARFTAYGWHVQVVEDGNDVAAVDTALRAAIGEEDRPSLVQVRTRIGYGAPTREGTPAAHGAPLGEEELGRTKERFGWPVDEPFHVPPDVREHVRALVAWRLTERRAWEVMLDALHVTAPELAREWDRTQAGDVSPGLEGLLPAFEEAEAVPTRKASGVTLRALAGAVPQLVGGSADLAESTLASVGGGSVQAGDYAGRTLHFGVREHAMGAVLNGMALHRGFRVFGSTFLVFSDYMRPSIRLAALMGLPVVFVFTHDSVAVGEDGPTHQPVEQLAALRSIPGLAVLRPADANETAEAWVLALGRRQGPTALVLTRQAVPVLPPPADGELARWGGRVVRDSGGEPDVALVATGSEVSLALAAGDLLAADGVHARVVSVPWRERFLDVGAAHLLPASVPRVVVEAGTPDMWHGLARTDGAVVGLSRFGASAPGPELMARLELTAEAVRDAAHRAVAARSREDEERSRVCRTS